MKSNISSTLREARGAILAAVATGPGGEARGPSAADPDALLRVMFDDLAELEATIASLSGARVELLNRVRAQHHAAGAEPTGPGAAMSERIFRAELATTLRISERFADDLIHTSEALAEQLPCTFAELREGAISYTHAREIVKTAWGIDGTDLAEFEEAVIPVACEKTVSGLKRKLRQFRDGLAPETLVERHRAARAERHVTVSPADDGMAYLTAYLSVVHARAIENRLADTARSLRGSGEARTKAHLMADVLTDALLDEHIPLTAWAGEDPLIRDFRTGRYGEGAWAADTASDADDAEHRGRDRINATGSVFSADDGDARDARTGFSFAPGRDRAPGHHREPEAGHDPSLLDPRYFDLGYTPPHPDDDGTPPPGTLCPDEALARYRGIAARVNVTVPVMTLLGHEETPGMLDGTIPIDPDTARQLAARAPSFTRLLTHPETGVVLSVGTDSYRPPEALRRWIRLRDGSCRFPGCSRRAENAEIDHGMDWQYGGPTNHDNLLCLCPGHHTLKHASEWTVRGHASIPGAFVWESPLGKEYTTYPATELPSAA